MVSSDKDGANLDNFLRKTPLEALFGIRGRKAEVALSASWNNVLRKGGGGGGRMRWEEEMVSKYILGRGSGMEGGASVIKF